MPYQTFDTADHPICIAAGNDRLFDKFAKVLGHPEWSADPRFKTGPDRNVHRAELIALIEPVLRDKPREHWLAAFTQGRRAEQSRSTAFRICRNRSSSKAMDILRTLPGCDAKVVGLPIQFNGERPHPYRDSPKVGEHNDEVFGALKADAAE